LNFFFAFALANFRPLVLLLFLALASAQLSDPSGLCGGAPVDFVTSGDLIRAPNFAATDDQDGFWNGDGNSGELFGIDTDTTNRYQLGFRPGVRYDPTNGPVAPMTTLPGNVVTIPNGETVKFDYTFRIYGSLDGTTTASAAGSPSTLQELVTTRGGRWEIGLDIDPSEATDFRVYDPYSFQARPTPATAFMQVDHSFLNAVENGKTKGMSNGADFASLMATSPAAQNSFIPRFLPGLTAAELSGTLDTQQGTITLPDDGRYEVYMSYSENGVELMRVAFSVFKGAFTSDVSSEDLVSAQCTIITE
jgi:hypothetical protein